MLVLVATNELQGTNPDDYSFTVEGELVTPLAVECASGARCGCNRGFPGLASGFATTTAMVVDRPGVTDDDLRDAVFDWMDRGGWIELVETAARERALERGGASDEASDEAFDAALDEAFDVDDLIESVIDEHVVMIEEICAAYPVGTVITRCGPLVFTRNHPFAA